VYKIYKCMYLCVSVGGRPISYTSSYTVKILGIKNTVGKSSITLVHLINLEMLHYKGSLD
jgi:hypothetical protein